MPISHEAAAPTAGATDAPQSATPHATDADAATQPTWLARVRVTLKPVVLDPQGGAVLHGLHQLSYGEVTDVRVGKYLELTLTAVDQASAETAVRQMCDRLLANPVIERYDVEVSLKG
ncbi:MAG TPA: phosphoribosylformylglycinamidine synthase subunit PurS [Ktedonobacterales bacterium]|nr:phosphoribosylformylglycinamidine synthase subunit PurS [Ktedonobacterales bacterium]